MLLCLMVNIQMLFSCSGIMGWIVTKLHFSWTQMFSIFTVTFCYLLASDRLRTCVCDRIRSMNGQTWLASCVHLVVYVCNVNHPQDHQQVWVCFLYQVWNLANWQTQVKMYSIVLLLSKFTQFIRWQALTSSHNWGLKVDVIKVDNCYKWYAVNSFFYLKK